jgi:UDP-glucose:(heptosyl)LPS alpha-1,3-glucosyltransferase
MKVALAHKRLDLRGGTERDLYRTAEGLRDIGHEVHLFCSEFGVAPPDGVIAHPLPGVPLGRTAEVISLAAVAPRALDRFDCDVTVSFGRMLRQDVIRCGGGSHKGFLRRMAGRGAARRFWQAVSLYHRSVLALERRQYSPGHFKRIIAVSRAVQDDLVENYRVPPEKITVLYNGVDTELFNPARRVEGGAKIRKAFNIPSAAPVVLFVGSGFQRKGLDRLLRAWNASKLSDAYLLVVGDDARLARYRTWAEQISRGKILFAGSRDDVEDFYAAADLVALPSLQEAFGNVVLEALASGVPVLVSAAAGAAEVLRGPFIQGIVQHSEDKLALTQKLEQLLERSRDTDYRQQARQLGEQYSWANHFQKLDSLLKEVAN